MPELRLKEGKAFPSPRRTWGKLVQASYILTDAVFVLLGGLILFSIRFYPDVLKRHISHQPIPLPLFWPYYAGFFVLYLSLIILLFKNYDLYRTPRGRQWEDESILVFKGVLFATLILMVFMYLSKMHISRFVVLSSWVVNTLSLASWRYVKRRIVEWRIAQGYGIRNALIVGAGKVGRGLAEIIRDNRNLGLHVKGFLDDRKEGEDILGGIKDLPRIIKSHFIEEVFVTIPSEREIVKGIADQARALRANVKVIPDLFDGIFMGSATSFGFLGRFPVMELYSEPIPEIGLFIKRVMDVVGAIVGLLLFLPVSIAIAIAIAIKIDSPEGPIIYRSRRVGRKGRVFNCYKFRTMVPNADEMKEELRRLNERRGPFFKITNDPRLTRVGRFIRRYSLDEIPQFLNVLKGDMSLVGPRPHPEDDFIRYDLDYYRRLDIKPGMTSLWAVKAQDDPSFETNLKLDLYYIENWSILLDLKIILLTIPTLLRGVGR